jgi:tetratricopeptide (TPR) repeat protein
MRRNVWMLAQWILVLIALGAIHTAAAREYPDPLACNGPTFLRIELPEHSERLHLHWSRALGPDVLLELRESGQDIAVDGAPGAIAVPVPPRLGVSLLAMDRPVRLEIARLRSSAAVGAVELHLHCQTDRATAIRRWFDAVADLLPSLGGGPGSLRDAEPEQSLAVIDGAAHDDRSRALAQHLRAQTLLLAGRSQDAAGAFALAAQRWQGVGDGERSAAAWVGVAEDLNRAGRYEDALAVTRGPGLPDGTHYFGARLENARCLALHYLDRLEQASACYAWTSERLDALNEVLELASTGIDFAVVELALGRVDSARRLLRASIDLARGPQALVIEGRARQALAGLAHRQTDLAEALSQLGQAEAVFAAAREPRWQSVALTLLARWLVDLGAGGDAEVANRQALALLDAQHAPARVAAANMVSARIELVARRPQTALTHAERALAGYAALKMPRDVALASLQQAEALLHLGRIDHAAQVLAGIDDAARQQDVVGHRYRLISAELALARADTVAARRHLTGPTDTLSWHRRIDHDRLIALLHLGEGDPAAALEHLERRRRAHQHLARSTGNALLAHAIGQSQLPLAELATDLIATEWQGGRLTAQHAADRLLPWLIDDRLPAEQDRAASHGDVGLDRTLGRLLSADTDSDDNQSSDIAQLTALLARLGRDVSVDGTPATRDRPALVLDRPWLALARGRQHAIRLWLTPGQPPVLRVFDPAALATPLDAVREALAHQNADLATLDQHAQALSAILLTDLPLPAAPAQLTVLADPISRTIPWPMLTWPGSSQPLVETTAITLMTPVDRLEPQDSAAPSLNVLIAAQSRVGQAQADPNTSAASLPTLTGALREPALIAEAMSPRPIITRTLDDRRDTLDALAQPGAWLHLSAHGQTRPDRLLASGLWLEPAQPGGAPEFFGWADALESGVGAELIVLNACQLAESSTAATAALDFASAISRAGARHTIAAQWPVSDTASAIWVPVFYRALTQTDIANPAQALAEARRALRASRAFRHPFHWAGWVHLERVAANRSVP